ADREASVHLSLFLKPEEIATERDEPLMQDWRELHSIRDQVLLKLEQLRKDKRIGKSLEAKVLIGAEPKTGVLLAKYDSALKELFNVSQVEVGSVDPDDKLYYLKNRQHIDAHSHVYGEPFVTHTVRLEVEDADGIKCERCWNYRTDTDQYGPW